MSDGLQIGVYGPGANGGMKFGGRRNNWRENKEADEVDVAQRFSQLSGQDFSSFEKVTQDSDVDVRGISAQGVQDFQITRLYTSDFWKDLNTGAVDGEVSPEELAGMIYTAAQKKTIKYPAAQRKDLVLLIDLNPAGIVSTVMDNVMTLLETRISNMNFKEVWLVGASDGQLFQIS